MAGNMVMKYGRYIEVAKADVDSEDPVVVGNITGVATTDTDSSGNVSIDREGVYDLSVKAIDLSGNTKVAIGDVIYYVDGDTPKLSKKASGIPFGIALETISTVGGTSTINVLQIGAIGDKGGPDIVENFRQAPVTSLKTGGATSGDDAAVNVAIFGENVFEFTNIGTQTIIAGVLTATGWNVARDQTDDEGIEINQGILANSPGVFTVGTDPAFYAKCVFSIADVSGTDDCSFGFRKAEAHQAAIDNYDEMATLNVISGDITIETILNGAATSATDTTDDWADAETHSLEVYVSAAGVVTFMIDGAAPSTTAAFTFDDGEVVLPFFQFINAAGLAGDITIERWEVGYQ